MRAREVSYSMKGVISYEKQMIRLERMFRFGIGVFFTVLEGLLSACVYNAIYLLLNMLLNNTVTIEHLNKPDFFNHWIFYRPLITYGFGYTQGQIGGGAVSRQIRLYLGDKFKRFHCHAFIKARLGSMSTHDK